MRFNFNSLALAISRNHGALQRRIAGTCEVDGQEILAEECSTDHNDKQCHCSQFCSDGAAGTVCYEIAQRGRTISGASNL